MKESEAIAFVDAINAIYKEKPLAKAVEDPRFEQLQEKGTFCVGKMNDYCGGG